jgi:Ni/Co efflux regulator RcnB
MKKLLTLTLLLSSFVFVGSTRAANVTTGAAFNNPQVRIQIGQRRRHRRDWDRDRDWAYGDRVGYGRTFTRDVEFGRHVYRETYQVRNGQTILISRVRLY